jgi:hypothetical protein
VNEENEIAVEKETEAIVFAKVFSDNLASGRGYICYFPELKESGVVNEPLIDLDFDTVDLQVL